ncbi:ABC-type antimicrobial peptide transport system permease subunit [Pedobacter sp. CAN_A7]|uniref:ABC transporter permease n=1 Tax=Pedobacter sp. CAN_A7 TaxID=2787722 RepID=UPI0018C9B6C4
MLIAKASKNDPMLALNFKIALRNIRKNPGFSIINIGGLAIGLASCMMLLLYVNYEWSYDKQFKDIDRIYFAQLNLKLGSNIITLQATPNGLAGTAAQEIPGIEVASRISDPENKLFSYQQQKIKLSFTYVDPTYLQIFDYTFLKGDQATALKQPNSVILTESAANKLFGFEEPIGKSLLWDNRKTLTVTAVIADPPKNQSTQFEALQTWDFYSQEYPNEINGGWGSINCATVFKLKVNADVSATDASLRKLAKAHHKESQMEIFLFPYQKYQLYDEFNNGKVVGGRIDQVRLFFFLAFCVLLIASINYMNLSTARSEKRAREVGVRKALGSSQRSLIGQFLMESLLLSFLAMIIAVALIELTLPYFNNLLEIVITINYHSPLFWCFLLALILATGFLAGCYPAFYLSSFTPVKVLKGFTNIGKASLPIRKLLVVFQFSLSIVMIIGATIVYSQIQFMKNKPLGFDKNNLVQMNLEGEFANPNKVEILKAALKNANVIVSATEYAADFTANGGSITGDFDWPGKNGKDDFIISYRSVGYDFVKTIGAKLVSGADYSRQLASDTASGVLLNQAAARMMALKQPVGTPITWGDLKLKVIGVVNDYHNTNLRHPSEPTVFYYNPKKSSALLLRLHPNQPLHGAVQTINKISQELNPAYPPALTYVSEGMEQKVKSERLLGVLSNIFGSFAIVISCLGLLGLALYMAEQRKREISIRKVLGADLKSILMLLNKDFIKLVLISNVIAIPVAYILLTNWLKTYDYKVSMGLWPYFMAAGISLTIAVFTISMQSFKVAKANPVDALKYE